MYYNTKYTQKLKPGFVAFYDIRPENRVGLLSREKISKQTDRHQESQAANSRDQIESKK